MHIIIATTTSESKKKYAEEKIKSYLQNNGVDTAKITFTAENIYTVDINILQKADLVVLIGPKPPSLNVSVIDGTAFIAKIPSLEATVCKEILSLVTQQLK